MATFWQKIKSNYKSCLINLIIFLITTMLMLFFGEGLLRWMGGYGFDSVELRQEVATAEPYRQP